MDLFDKYYRFAEMPEDIVVFYNKNKNKNMYLFTLNYEDKVEGVQTKRWLDAYFK